MALLRYNFIITDRQFRMLTHIGTVCYQGKYVYKVMVCCMMWLNCSLHTPQNPRGQKFFYHYTIVIRSLYINTCSLHLSWLQSLRIHARIKKSIFSIIKSKSLLISKHSENPCFIFQSNKNKQGDFEYSCKYKEEMRWQRAM